MDYGRNVLELRRESGTAVPGDAPRCTAHEEPSDYLDRIRLDREDMSRGRRRAEMLRQIREAVGRLLKKRIG